MVEIEIENGEAVKIHIKGTHKFFALKSQVYVPLAHINSVEIGPEKYDWSGALKLPGSFFPGVIAAGTFYQHGKKLFWDVHDMKNAITLHLQGDEFNEVVVEVADPQATVATISEALAAYRAKQS